MLLASYLQATCRGAGCCACTARHEAVRQLGHFTCCWAAQCIGGKSHVAAASPAWHKGPDSPTVHPPTVQGMLSAGSAASSHTVGSTASSTRLLSSFGLCPPVALVGLRLGPKLGRLVGCGLKLVCVCLWACLVALRSVPHARFAAKMDCTALSCVPTATHNLKQPCRAAASLPSTTASCTPWCIWTTCHPALPAAAHTAKCTERPWPPMPWLSRWAGTQTSAAPGCSALQGCWAVTSSPAG